MKHSIRTRFTLGMIFLFLIILILCVFSGYYLNKLSDKTSAILKENYLSVVYAREMSEGLINIDKEITVSFLSDKKPDSLKIVNELLLINKSLLAEKNNITEPGEDKLVSGIESDYSQYRDSVLNIVRFPESIAGLLYLQAKSEDLHQKLVMLSRMNGNAIEMKTDDAKAFSKSSLTQMTILASLCFLIGMGFIFSFSAYFSQRFFQLYNGIKEIASNNYDQHLYFYGKDEFYEISLVFNEIADKLKKNMPKMDGGTKDEQRREIRSDDIEELKQMLLKIRNTEIQASALISKFEKKQ
jgi:two-component system, NtrC family, sensor histidine kinase KinB